MNIELFLTTLPIMGKGMLGIFAVIAAIMLCIWGLNKFTKNTDED